jgi:hypothetical protein
VISFSCSHCGAAIRAKDSSAGLKGKCKKCGTVVVVPTPAVEEAELAPSEWESSDWGVESDEQDPYTRMPNLSRPRKTHVSENQNSKGRGWLLTFALVFAGAAGLVITVTAVFWLISRLPSKIDDGDAFRDLDRSAAELTTAIELGTDREEYGKLVRHLSLEIDLAGRRVTTSSGRTRIERYRELRDILVDAGKVWDVKLSIPALRNEADRHQKFLSYAGGSIESYVEFKSEVTLTGIPMMNFEWKKTGLDEIAQQYRLPVTTTKSGFNIIPMDSVEQVFMVAREKLQEIEALR